MYSLKGQILVSAKPLASEVPTWVQISHQGLWPQSGSWRIQTEFGQSTAGEITLTF